MVLSCLKKVDYEMVVRSPPYLHPEIDHITHSYRESVSPDVYVYIHDVYAYTHEVSNMVQLVKYGVFSVKWLLSLGVESIIPPNMSTPVLVGLTSYLVKYGLNPTYTH